MRRIALINQKGGVGKTTVAANLGAALALAGRRVVVVDLDPQANLTLYLGLELPSGAPTSYRVLLGETPFALALRPTGTPNLRILPTDIDLSGAELELASADGRERLLRDALEAWRAGHAADHPGEEPADYVLFDCPPSLGLLALNALAAAGEAFLVVQTHFLALQGTSKLVEVIDLVKRELNPALELTGIVPCLYDSRMRLAREVLSELRRYFPEQCFRTPISANVKLAESPSFGKTIFEYAPDSVGARDFASLSHEVLVQEVRPERGPRARAARLAEAFAAHRRSGAPAAGAKESDEAGGEPEVTIEPAPGSPSRTAADASADDGAGSAPARHDDAAPAARARPAQAGGPSESAARGRVRRVSPDYS